MFFTSDNASGAAPDIMAALTRANTGYARGYGADDIMARVTGQIRTLFDAPQAAVYLVATGTAANALALANYIQPYQAVFAHQSAHIAVDECGAPEFFTNGAKLIAVAGDHGKMTPDTLADALARIGTGGVHGVQRGILSITNLTEAGTLYSATEIAQLSAIAKSYNLPVHMDGARFANAFAAQQMSQPNLKPADVTWRAGIDILSFGGTKNGCLGVEAVVMFDPAKAWDFELRRKRGGHLFSKHRYLSAQIEAYLTDDLWLRLAMAANQMGAKLAAGLTLLPETKLLHPAPANMMFTEWPLGTNARAFDRGAAFYDIPSRREGARLVASWSTTDTDIDNLLAALRP
jgi:threonine aldolase